MIFVCSECGKEIPEGMDFCPFCGRMKDSALCFDDKGNYVPSVCSNCGAVIEDGASFCIKCGAKVQEPVVPVRLTLRKNGMLALMLGLIFGIFNIYGIGHLVMKKWSRGLMFLAMSAVMFYIDPHFITSSSFFAMVLRMMIFMYQSMDLLGLVYAPEGK